MKQELQNSQQNGVGPSAKKEIEEDLRVFTELQMNMEEIMGAMQKEEEETEE